MEELNNSKIYKNIEENSKEIKNIKMLIKELNKNMNKKEDDIKNLLNEKDQIIKELNNKIKEQEKIIKENKNDIIQLNKKIDEMKKELLKELKEKELEINNKNEEKLNNMNENIIKENNILKKDINNKYNELITMNDNYIILNLDITKEDLGKNIKFLNQSSISNDNYFKNFELNDTVIIIDNKNVSSKYKKMDNYKQNEKSKNCDEAQYISYKLNSLHYFYYNFTKEGIHIIKIIFLKKLTSCQSMFSNCDKIIEIDLSHFNCSYVEKLFIFKKNKFWFIRF